LVKSDKTLVTPPRKRLAPNYLQVRSYSSSRLRHFKSNINSYKTPTNLVNQGLGVGGNPNKFDDRYPAPKKAIQ